jgi:hypothetical protein
MPIAVRLNHAIAGISEQSHWTAIPSPSALHRTHLTRVEDPLTLAIVHVRSHSRQRQTVVSVRTFARVSMILPLQNGHTAGRAKSPANRDSGMMLFPFSDLRNPERTVD